MIATILILLFIGVMLKDVFDFTLPRLPSRTERRFRRIVRQTNDRNKAITRIMEEEAHTIDKLFRR